MFSEIDVGNSKFIHRNDVFRILWDSTDSEIFCLSICGFLFLYECLHNKNDILERPNLFQIILLLLYCLYPLISLVLGNQFPQMVTHIMPCPIVSLSIAVYAGYKRKSKLLLLLLTIWGLTGIKSVIFAAYEDIILLICGIYGLYLLAKEFRLLKLMKVT